MHAGKSWYRRIDSFEIHMKETGYFRDSNSVFSSALNHERTWVLPSVVHICRKEALKASCCCEPGSFAINKAWPMVMRSARKHGRLAE